MSVTMYLDRSTTKRLHDIWSRAAESLDNQLGNDVFSSWFGSIRFDSMHDGIAHLSVPTKFLARWLKLRYKSHLLGALQAQMPEMRDVEIRVRRNIGTPLLKHMNLPLVPPEIIPIEVPEPADPIEAPIVDGAPKRHPRMEEIVQLVGKFYGVSSEEIYSETRTERIVLSRQIAMYLIKATDRSSSQIGNHFGGKNHSTVLHAVEKIKQLTKTNPKIAQQIEILSDSISVLQKKKI